MSLYKIAEEKELNDSLRQVITAIADSPSDLSDSKLASLGATFRQAFLSGYETEDNIGCMDEIQVGRTFDGTSARRPIIGYVIPALGVDIADVLNSAEGCDVPQQLRAAYPKITQEQWDATLRLATMIIIALQGDPMKDGGIAE